MRNLVAGSRGARFLAAVPVLGLMYLAFAGGAAAQGNPYGQSGAAPAQSGNAPASGQAPGRGGRGPAIDPAEETALKAFNAAASDPAAQIKAGQDFESKFPNSRYMEAVQGTLVTLYYNQQDYPDFYAEADKALAKYPDNVPVLTIVGWMIPRDYKADDPSEPAKLDKAEQYAKHALDLIPAMQKPPRLTDDQFNQAKASAASQAHSGLGMTYFRKNAYADSAKELESATGEATDVDPADLYILGVDYQKLTRNSDAARAFSRCAQIPGSLQDRCKQGAASAQNPSLAPAN